MHKLLQKISLLLVLFPGIALSQINLQDVIKPEEGQPINITSENMIIQNQKNLAIFKNNVHVTQGKMQLWSDEVRLHTEYDEKTKKSKFKLIEAEGNVNFESEDNKVKSNLAEYDVINGILVLTNNVYIKNSDSSLAGKLFKYYVRTGRSEISNSGPAVAGIKNDNKDDDAKSTSSGGRVRAVFTPGEEVKNFQMPMDAIQGVRGVQAPVVDTDEIQGKKTDPEDLNPAKEELEKMKE